MTEDWGEDLPTDLFRKTTSLSRCIDDWQLAAYADGALDDSGRADIEHHLADCGRCAHRVAFLVRVEGSAEASPPEHVIARAKKLVRIGPASSWSPASRRWAAVAASTALAVTAVWLWWPIEQRTSESKRGGERETRLVEPGAVHGPEIVSPGDGAVVSPAELVARWEGVPGVLFYEIRLLTESGDLLLEERVAGAELDLPEALVLEPGRYFLRVRAVLAEGQSLASRHVSFVVEGPG